MASVVAGMLLKTPITSPGLAVVPEAPDMCYGDNRGMSAWQVAATGTLEGSTALAGRMSHTAAKQQAAYSTWAQPDASGVEMPPCSYAGSLGGNDWDAMGSSKANYQQTCARDMTWGQLAQDRSFSSAETRLLGPSDGKLQGGRGTDSGCCMSLEDSLHIADYVSAGTQDWSVPQAAHVPGRLACASDGGHLLPGGGGGGDRSMPVADMLRLQMRLSTSNTYSALASGFSGFRQASVTTLTSSSTYDNLTKLATVHHHHHHYYHPYPHQGQGNGQLLDAPTMCDDVDTVGLSSLPRSITSTGPHEGHASNEWPRSAVGPLLHLSATAMETTGDDNGCSWGNSMDTVIGGYRAGLAAGTFANDHTDHGSVMHPVEAVRCQLGGDDQKLVVERVQGGRLHYMEDGTKRVGYSSLSGSGHYVFVPTGTSQRCRGDRIRNNNHGGMLGHLAPSLASPHESDLSSNAPGGLRCSVGSSEDVNYRGSREAVSTGEGCAMSIGDRHRWSGSDGSHGAMHAGAGILAGFLGGLYHKGAPAVGDLGEPGGEAGALPGLAGRVDGCWPLALEEVRTNPAHMVYRDAANPLVQALVGSGPAGGMSPVLADIPGTVAAMPSAPCIMNRLSPQVGSPETSKALQSAGLSLASQVHPQQPRPQQAPGSKVPSARRAPKSKEGAAGVDTVVPSLSTPTHAPTQQSPSSGASRKQAVGANKSAGGKQGSQVHGHCRDGVEPGYQTARRRLPHADGSVGAVAARGCQP
eukprot:jgi/Mesvir1/26525/Mv16180-RA.2